MAECKRAYLKTGRRPFCVTHQRDEIRCVQKERDLLKKEVGRLSGPFMCSHDPQYVGGACAACHAEALARRDRHKDALEQVSKAVGDGARHFRDVADKALRQPAGEGL